MSLKIENRKKIIKYSIWGIIIFVVLMAFLRIVIFEKEYYSSKEGSERAVAYSSDGDNGAPGAVVLEELIEEEPKAEEVREYTVSPDKPRYLKIDKLGIKRARILPMGVDANGALDTPRNIFDVGWFVGSGKPGTGGTMIIDGHNGGPHVNGVFKKLPTLSNGDLIAVERGDGVVFNYRVVENNSVLLSEADEYMGKASTSPEPGKESITLITCTGEWSQQRQTYLSRQFTRAVLVEE